MAQVCPFKCKNGRIYNTVLRTWQNCPQCTNILADLSSNKEPNEEQQSILTRLNIPEQYIGCKFDKDSFFSAGAARIFATQTYKTIIEQLIAIDLALSSSRVLCESCYFYTGLYADTLTYVYYCLQTAVRHGLTTVPYVSLIELQGIRDNVRQMAKVYDGTSYYDYLVADVCFLSVTASAPQSEIYLLAELLNERAKRGLPTYVFGYWAESALHANHNSLHFLIDSTAKHLHFMHPYEVMTKSRYAEHINASNPTTPLLGIQNDTVPTVVKPLISGQNLGGVGQIPTGGNK